MTTANVIPIRREVEWEAVLVEDAVRGLVARRGNAKSRATMTRNLERAARLLSNGQLGGFAHPWPNVDGDRMGRLVAELNDMVKGREMAPSYANVLRGAARSAVKACWRAGLVDQEHLARVEDISRVKGSNSIPGRALTFAEQRALMESLPDTASGRRDGALLAVLLGAGLRRDEAARLRLEDWTGSALNIHASKGNKSRQVPVPDSVASYVRGWLDLRGDVPGALLCRVLRSGRMPVEDGELPGLTGQSIDDRVKRAQAVAGVDAFTCHDCRRTYITDLLDQGCAIQDVQRLAGHASIETTSSYQRSGEASAREAAMRRRFPAIRQGG
jgi:integrase